MGWIKKEVKGFSKEFARQGSILLFGKAPKFKHHNNHNKKVSGAERQYNKAQQWARRNGYK